MLNKSLAGFISIQHFVRSLSLLARLKKKRPPEYFDGLFSQIFIKNCSLMLCFFRNYNGSFIHFLKLVLCTEACHESVMPHSAI